MGNENSKNKEATQNGTIPEKHENGSANVGSANVGSANVVSANVTSNGLEIDVKGETVIHQNGGAPSLNYSTESTEPDYVVVEAQCQPVEVAVISKIPETSIQKEEVKKSKEEKGRLFGKMFKKKAEPPADVKSVPEKEKSGEDEMDAGPPATDPQPESGSSGDEAATMIVAEDFECLCQKAEMSTQTDRKTEADISTQTGEDGDYGTATNTEGPVEEVVAATEEDWLNESVVIAEEAVEETADEEPRENQTAGIIIEEVVMENIIYENFVFRAERVEVTDNFEITHIKNYNPEEERVQETEPEVAADPEFIKEGEIAVEETHFEETVTLEIANLPKVVADCVEAVFAAVSESTDFAAVNTPEPSVDEVITEGNSEGARDIPADVVLIETTEPKTNAATSETKTANGVASLDEEPVTMMMEIISEVVCEEPNPPPAHKDMPERERRVPLVPIVIIMKEYSYEGATTDEAVAVEDVSGMSEEAIIVEAPSNELITTEDALNAPVDEVKPESIPKDITPDEKTEVCKGMTADEEPETAEEAERRPVIVKDDAEMIPEAAIDALSQYLELCAIAPQQPAVDNGSLFEEEVITATTFVPLSGERHAKVSIPGEPIESVDEEAVISEEPAEENPSPCEEDATTEVLVNILESVVEEISERLVVTENIFEALADVPQMDATGESEHCAALQEEPVVENVARSVVAVEEPTDSSHVISEEPLEESMSPLAPQVRVVILKTIEDEVTAELINESNHSCEVVAAIDEDSGDSQIATSNEAAVECFEAVLETIVEEIFTEDAIPSQEPAVENDITLEEGVIAAGPFAPLSGEREANFTIPEESRETTAEEIKEEATNPESVEEDTTVQASSNEEEVTQIASSNEHAEEKTEETANLKQEAESLPEPESVTPGQGPEEEKAPETEDGNSDPAENQEDSNPEENPVMNFFKTLVTPTKTTKKETAAPDATKDQSQTEAQPAAITTVAQVSEPPAAPKGMSIPPPPPPEPPKMEIKGEPAAKPVKPTPKEEPKAAAKEPESSKGKSAKDTLSKFFRPKVLLGLKAFKGKGASASGAKTAAATIKDAPKPEVETEVQETPVEVPEPVVEVQSEKSVEPHETAEEVAKQQQVVEEAPQPVVEDEKVDPSKASTLEAAAKPEPPPAVQEEKKPASKSSFMSLFKPKELLDHMTAKVQAASTSGVRLLRRTAGVAADPKKATPAPAAAAEAAQTAKAKEEPKAAAKSSEAAADNKPASAAPGDEPASVPKKLEKRNSIHLFFKNLGQRRNSSEAGVQTEPVTVTPAAEKAK